MTEKLNMRGPWTIRESVQTYDNPWIQVTEHQVLTPQGRPGIYGTVHFKNLATGVVPIDAAGCVTLVGQYRFPLDAYSWEIPEGGGKPGEPALAAAQRELLEETGLIGGQWLEILRMDLSNSISDEQAVAFLAWDLVPGPSCPDDDEALDLRRLPFGDALRMVWNGEIRDAITVAALLKVGLMAERGTLPAAVAQALRR